ncbi:unnamed protein product [Durusdinium trenchii]|uniref:Ubiquitin-conjugating enzyme E2 Z (E2 ubiquitin-conjugating enzyme Z) (Uba6-specific E2 conjugating enzyme 1) (Use1) (Ubiquitin carrier protein Z) (Ubiquitin-protein ligase Z) n=2 Tax=Durusdinium trenchii TaxID=1381693 RepID=A0ABP0LL56_9DINO
MFSAVFSDELGEDYNGALSVVASRRLLREQAALHREGLELQGVFHHFDEANPHKAAAVVLGPDETPYARCPFLFEFTFPNTYPMKPPHAKLLTRDGRVRFNPNLYVNGKVCLSILGTWAGPSWTSLSTFRTVLISIQSLLCSNPLQNEPGHEHETSSDCDLYAAMVRYESVAIAALQLGKTLPPCFEPLRALLGGIFLCNYSVYCEMLAGFVTCEGRLDRCPLYGFVTKYAPRLVRQQLDSLQATLLTQPEAVQMADELQHQALALCMPEASSEELPTGSGSEASQPLRPTHVAHGLWRVGPGARRFLRRCCFLSLVTAGVSAAVGVAISFAGSSFHALE